MSNDAKKPASKTLKPLQLSKHSLKSLNVRSGARTGWLSKTDGGGDYWTEGCFHVTALIGC
jgi:hypothetical protein